MNVRYIQALAKRVHTMIKSITARESSLYSQYIRVVVSLEGCRYSLFVLRRSSLHLHKNVIIWAVHKVPSTKLAYSLTVLHRLALIGHTVCQSTCITQYLERQEVGRDHGNAALL